MLTSDQLVQTCKRFNAICWHDSELRGVFINYSRVEHGPEYTYEIILKVDLSTQRTPAGGEVFVPTEIRFIHSRYIHTDLDLLGMGYCGGDISHATCSEESDFKHQLFETKISEFDLPQDPASWTNLKHFRIALCNPSGEIDIIAEDFALKTLAARVTSDGRTITLL